MLVVIIIAFAFLVCLSIKIAVDRRNPSKIGKTGENKVSSVLHSLPREYLVLNNVVIPDQKTVSGNNYTTQIDHLVVSPFGIFVIETKNYSGWIYGEEKSKRWKETFKTTKGQYFYNPVKQNWGHAYALAEHLHLDINIFKPIVVFSNNCKLQVDSTTPVIYMSQLKRHILSYKQEIIPRKEIEPVFDQICKISLVGGEVENQHIQSIGERFSEKEAVLQKGICPRCGGELKLRNGKYGTFYGCSNYPNVDLPFTSKP